MCRFRLLFTGCVVGLDKLAIAFGVCLRFGTVCYFGFVCRVLGIL